MAAEGGWRQWLAAPQPGSLAHCAATLPTPLGDVRVAFEQSSSAVQAELSVPAQSSAQVCLPPVRGGPGAGGAQLAVDGQPVATVAMGRLLCTAQDVTAGVHTVVRS